MKRCHEWLKFGWIQAIRAKSPCWWEGKAYIFYPSLTKVSLTNESTWRKTDDNFPMFCTSRHYKESRL